MTPRKYARRYYDYERNQIMADMFDDYCTGDCENCPLYDDSHPEWFTEDEFANGKTQDRCFENFKDRELCDEWDGFDQEEYERYKAERWLMRNEP